MRRAEDTKLFESTHGDRINVVIESRNDDNDDASQDLKWMDWDCNHDGGGGNDYYDD
jgi:hypothetical protein